MNSSERHPSPSCQVIDGNKLPAESGGADALCREIAAATAEAAPGFGYKIEIRVLPRSRLSATVTTADERRLPGAGHGEHGQALDGRFVQAVRGLNRGGAGEGCSSKVMICMRAAAAGI